MEACPGTGEDSLMVETCLGCDCDIDLEGDLRGVEEELLLSLLMFKGLVDMIGYALLRVAMQLA